MDIKEFQNAVLKQDAEKLRTFFHDSAYVNCEYSGDWDGTSERIEKVGNLIITAVKVFPVTKEVSFHIIPFMEIENDKIIAMNEYWGDDGSAPQWRLDKHIGTTIC
ncbi:nuclear transport factor 2 family protein [Clostridium sp. HBUAS56010]|uniref:nuclear transport factor 2 family protein n=1 Tax=Clostridium sp. HBUAS56010 TaxID=2571127 RepID=UPI00117898F8|nr:nuclear transport factor 2 family protein [Clostridium sp. HBUAS56010]